MTHTVIRAEIVEDGMQEEYQVESYGDLKYIPRNIKTVHAIFGVFERTTHGTLLYSATIEREDDGTIGHYPDSEYLDDYRALKTGQITPMY